MCYIEKGAYPFPIQYTEPKYLLRELYHDPVAQTE